MASKIEHKRPQEEKNMEAEQVKNNTILTYDLKIRTVKDFARDMRDIYIFQDYEINAIDGSKKRYVAEPINLTFKMIDIGEHVPPTLMISEDYAADFLRAFQDIHVEPAELEKKLAVKDAMIKSMERVIAAKDDQIASLKESTENLFRMLKAAKEMIGPYEVISEAPIRSIINNGCET